MEYSFKSLVYKVGVNPCVDVPQKISKLLEAQRGYIRIKGTINGHLFKQTLVPVKNGPYRLYVNGPMMKGGKVLVNDIASFRITQDDKPPVKFKMTLALKKTLGEHKQLARFKMLRPSRQQEVLRYLSRLKSEDAIQRNIQRVVKMLKENKTSLW